MTRNSALIALAIVLASIIGFAVGRSVNLQNAKPSLPQSTQNIPSNPLFKSQNATFMGKIIQVSGRTLTIQSDSNQLGEVQAANNIIIYKFPLNSPTASASSDLKVLETGKRVLINVELIKGIYQAVTISYFRNP